MAPDAQFKLDIIPLIGIATQVQFKMLLLNGGIVMRGNMLINFKSSCYHQFVTSIQALRAWLSYSRELMKPYCEVNLFFADRSKQIFDQMACVSGGSGSTQCMRKLQITLSHRLFILNGSPVKR